MLRFLFIKQINCKFLSHFDSETAAFAFRLIAAASLSFDGKPFASVSADKRQERRTEKENITAKGTEKKSSCR